MLIQDQAALVSSASPTYVEKNFKFKKKIYHSDDK